MAKLHAHSCTPARKPPKQALPDIERQHNRQLALAAGYPSSVTLVRVNIHLSDFLSIWQISIKLIHQVNEL